MLRMLTSDHRKGHATGHRGALRAGCTTARRHGESDVTGGTTVVLVIASRRGEENWNELRAEHKAQAWGNQPIPILSFFKTCDALRNAAPNFPLCPPNCLLWTFTGPGLPPL